MAGRLPYSGWMKPLPERARAELERRWRDVPVAPIERAFGNYLIERDSDQPSAQELRRLVADFKAKARALTETMRVLEPTVWAQQLNHRAGQPGLMTSLLRDLELARTAAPGRSVLVGGRLRNPRHVLTNELAAILEAAGLVADRRPNGPLCQVLELVLHAAGETPSNAVEIVKPVLRRRAALKKAASLGA